MDAKAWWQSKTVWTNVLLALAAILSYLAVEPTFQAYAVYVLITVNVINIVLRFITTQPLTTTPEERARP